jgi:hypothetical protein
MEIHFRNWHISDPVDADEEQRNEDIYDLQYNRNPFIDHPEFVERISSFFSTAMETAAPEIAAAPAQIDLGTVGFSTTAYHTVAVINTGNDTLNVASVTSTDPDFDVSQPSLVLEPETYAYIRVSYTSADTDGSDSTSILIMSDDGDEGLIEIPVTVQVSETAGIEDEPAPARFYLYQNHPNPFGKETIISFDLARPAEIDLAVYNIEGQLVHRLIDGRLMPSGRHRLHFEGGNLPSGVYYYRLCAGSHAETRRMLFLRGLSSR